jgi:hypothetical protein
MPSRAAPQVPDQDGHAAIERIISRRDEADDPHTELLDPDDPVALIKHVSTCNRVPEWVMHHDVVDSLWVVAYIRSRLPHRPDEVAALEDQLLRHGRKIGVKLKDLAPPLGLSSPAGVKLRLDRAEAVRLGLPPNERALRAHRRAEQAAEAGVSRALASWYSKNGYFLYEAAAALATSRRDRTLDRLIDDAMAENLSDLREAAALVPFPVTSASFPALHALVIECTGVLEDLSSDQYADYRARVGALVTRLDALLRSYNRV